MKTRADVIARAFRRLEIAAVDEALTADQSADGTATLDALMQEAGLEEVTDEGFLALTDLLAAEIAPAYGVQAPVTRTRAWLRLMATVRGDDRESRFDPPVYF